MKDNKNGNLPTIFVEPDRKLPDNGQWTNRFEVHSESSSRVYIIAQNIEKRHWACSCPGWRIHRTCKHLAILALPPYERPYDVQLKG